MRPCSIAGLWVDRSRLNDAGEIRAVRSLLDGVEIAGSGPMAGESLSWLRATCPDLRGSQEATALRADGGQVIVAAVKKKTGMLGLGTTVYAVAIGRGSPPTLLCEPVPGKPGGSGWQRVTR